MLSTLLAHPFSEADELWLQMAADTETFNPRIARIKLYDKVPRDFEPTQIDKRFYENDKLTPIGLRRFAPESKLLRNMAALAVKIKDEILNNPGIEMIEVDPIADALGIDRLDLQQAIKGLQDVSSFFTGLSHAQGSSYIERVHFSGPSGYDGPLKFTSLDAALEKLYRIQNFGAGLRFNNRSDESTTTSAGKRSGPVGKRSQSVKKNTAFVIMAIDPNRPELEDVLDAIKTVSGSFGITAFRADEIEHQGVITNVVLESIRDCEYLIADLTHERPNVYYEIGYAHSLDKKPILYRRAGTKLHFDLSVHNVPEYANVRELRELLKKRFEAILGRTAA